MNEYNKICESIMTMKTTSVTRYPKQIQLSEEFLSALKSEIDRITVLDESDKDPIRNFQDKFLKALKFEVSAKCKQK